MASELVTNGDVATHQELLIKDVEAQDCKVPFKKPRKRKQIKIHHFPIFIIGISIVQVYFTKSNQDFFIHFIFPTRLIQIILMYTVDKKRLAMLFGIDPHRRHELWRFFTVMFVHTG